MSIFSKLSRRPYKDYSDEKLYSCFKSENWPEDIKDRQKLLKEVAYRQCEERNCGQYPKITFGQGEPEDCGWYNDGKIWLNNVRLDDPYEALDSVCHETNHHIQDQSLTNDNITDYSEEEKALIHAEMGPGYTPYREGPDYYENQGLELDSNNYGFEAVTKHHELFKDDPAYSDYLDRRQDFFDRRQEFYEDTDSHAEESEKAHIDRAAGSIDADELQTAKDYVSSEDNRFRNTAFENIEKCEELKNDAELAQNQTHNQILDTNPDHLNSNTNEDNIEFVDLGEGNQIADTQDQTATETESLDNEADQEFSTEDSVSDLNEETQNSNSEMAYDFSNQEHLQADNEEFENGETSEDNISEQSGSQNNDSDHDDSLSQEDPEQEDDLYQQINNDYEDEPAENYDFDFDESSDEEETAESDIEYDDFSENSLNEEEISSEQEYEYLDFDGMNSSESSDEYSSEETADYDFDDTAFETESEDSGINYDDFSDYSANNADESIEQYDDYDMIGNDESLSGSESEDNESDMSSGEDEGISY